MPGGGDITVSGCSGAPRVGQAAEASVGRSMGSVLGQKAQGLLISRVHGRRGAVHSSPSLAGLCAWGSPGQAGQSLYHPHPAESTPKDDGNASAQDICKQKVS